MVSRIRRTLTTEQRLEAFENTNRIATERAAEERRAREEKSARLRAARMAQAAAGNQDNAK